MSESRKYTESEVDEVMALGKMTLAEAFKVLEVEPQWLRTSPTNAFWCYTDTQKQAIDLVLAEMWEVMEDRRESSDFHAKVTQDHWASIKSRIESKVNNANL